MLKKNSMAFIVWHRNFSHMQKIYLKYPNKAIVIVRGVVDVVRPSEVICHFVWHEFSVNFRAS